jgi:transcriptional regulator with XRE-family HTH domain
LKQEEIIINRHIGEKIKQRRKALNLNQAELAKLLDYRTLLHTNIKIKKGIDRIVVSKLWV